MIEVNLLAQTAIDEFGASPWFRFVYLPFAIALFAWVLGLLTEMYKRKRDEKLEKTKVQFKLDAQLKELLNIERIKAVSHFATQVEQLREGIDSSYGGGCILAWCEPYQSAQSASKDTIERAVANAQMMNEIDQYVNRNAMLLGKALVLFWRKYQKSLHALAANLLTVGAEPLVCYALGELRSRMYNDLTRCLEATVGLPARDLADANMRKEAEESGLRLGNELFEAAKEKWGSAPAVSREVIVSKGSQGFEPGDSELFAPCDDQ